MAKKVKIDIRFDGFAAIAEELDRFPGALKEATIEAMEASAKIVNEKLHERMKKHEEPGRHKSISGKMAPNYGKGSTQKTILDHRKADVHGNIIEQKVGFDISHGGLPSIFLMYGTPRHYQPSMHRMHPGMNADKVLYNAVYGKGMRTKLNRQQKEIFESILRKYGGHWNGKHLD